MSKQILGFDEWIPDPMNVAKAQHVVAQLERKYQQLTRQTVEVVECSEPLGSGALGEFVPESGRIVLYEGANHELSLGAKAEELLHYFNYRGRGLLGLTTNEIGDDLVYQMEVLVERCIEKCGFVRFRSR